MNPPAVPSLDRQNLDVPPLPLGVFDVHAKEIAGEQGRLVAARAGPHLENRVALVGGIFRQERDADRLGHRFRFGFGGGELSAGHGAHVRVQTGIHEQCP